MTPEEAIRSVAARFPFEGYVFPEKASGYYHLVRTVCRHLPPGGRVLDFGCGPCNQTAVLQLLGYKCSGYDDLQDGWHKLPGNKDKIVAFAREFGVDLHVADGGPLPFAKASFDMIMLHNVLEHFHCSPRELLNDLLELVVPGGLLFVTIPNAASFKKRLAVLLGRTNMPAYATYYWFHGPWRGHIREYVKDDLVKLASYLSLAPLEAGYCDQALHQVPRGLLTAYRCITWCFRSWKDSCVLCARKQPNWSPRRALLPEEAVGLFSKYADYGY
jgi:SAM-dependent methyltransferase